MPKKPNHQEENDYLRLHLELLDSDGNPADAETTRTLRECGEVRYGNTISRDILVSKEMPLWALHYAIQRCFGWQNSHLHNFVLPMKQFEALTDRQTKQYVMLIGLVFRSPWMKGVEEF